ncbi:hypothetical protein KY343_03615 [Candidatus Woesearchaeota archaeon]|nr:hypothetical protein [Candidatus Woesearchaeota archaeon]
MGYRTTYNGKIVFNPKNKILIYLLKFLKRKSSPCNYLTRSDTMGHTTHAFYLEDEWIGYCVPLDIINFEKGELDFDGDENYIDFKDYCDATLTLIFIISYLDKTANGQVWWEGEEINDKGTIKLRKGNVILKPRGVNQKIIDIKKIIETHQLNINMGKKWRNSKDTIIAPKIDILNFLKDMKASSFEEFQKEFKKHMLVEML